MEKVLKAIACPYGALDAKGRAQSLVPQLGNPSRRVGARYDLTTSAAEGKSLFVVSKEPQTIVCNDSQTLTYYRRSFQEGALIAADKETALVVGVPFREPELVLAQRRREAVAAWKDQHGEEPKSIDHAMPEKAAEPAIAAPGED